MNRLIEIYNWFSIFLSPFILLNALGIYIYWSNENLWLLTILLSIIGFVLGIFFAEKIRKRRGTSQFMAELNHTNDVKSYEEIVQEENTHHS